MIQKIINRIKDKFSNKHYAVFVDSKGRQREVISINNNKNKFSYDSKAYIKNINKYSNFHTKEKKLIFFTQHHNYFFYQYNYSEPINFTKEKLHLNKSGSPYIAEDINSMLETKVLKDLNKVDKNIFGNLEPKQIIMGIGIIIGIIYFVLNGGM